MYRKANQIVTKWLDQKSSTGMIHPICFLNLLRLKHIRRKK